MKRIITIFLLIAATTIPGFAQTDDTDEQSETKEGKGVSLRIPTSVGKYLVGSDLLFANAAFQKGIETSYTVGLSPTVGCFVLPNIALGLALDLTLSGHKGYQSISYGFSPFARVYFAHDNGDKPVRPLQFFIQAEVGFGGTNSRYDEGGHVTRTTTNGPRVSMLPGVDYFLNEHVAAELGIEYLFIGGKPDAHIIGLNVGFQLFLGR